MLWDESSSSFDTSRLPSTAKPELIEFYKQLPSRTGGDDDAGGCYGKEWFDLVSDLPGCDYFVQGPDSGKQYELAPTMNNISKVCYRLMVDGDAKSTNSPIWTSLHDLSKDWKAYSLQVQTDTLLHSTDTQKSGDLVARHEFATLQTTTATGTTTNETGLHPVTAAIEIRMRCVANQKSGFCAVTHLRQPKPVALSQSTLERLRRLSFLPSKSSNDNFTIRLLSLALTPDIGLLQQQQQHSGDDDDDTVEELVHDLLSTPLGVDRRGVMMTHHQNNTTDNNNDGLQQEWNQKEFETSRRMLRSALYRVCNLHTQDPESCGLLLPWILQESPVVVESSSSTIPPSSNSIKHDHELEAMLLSLPEEYLANPMVQNSLYHNDWGLIRGKLLAACAQYKTGKVSLWDILLGDLSAREVLSVLSLLYSFSKSTN